MAQILNRFWMIYSWRRGEARLVKRRPVPMPGEIVIRLDLTLDIPTPEIPVIDVSYNVPAAHIAAIEASEPIEAELKHSEADDENLRG